MSNWKDWIDIIIIGVMILCVTIAIQYYFNTQQRECVKEPLLYSAKYMEERYGYEFNGVGRFSMEGGPIITFNKFGVEVEYPYQNSKNINPSDLIYDP